MAVHGLREAFSRARNTIPSFVLRTLSELRQRRSAANFTGARLRDSVIPLAFSQAARDAV